MNENNPGYHKLRNHYVINPPSHRFLSTNKDPKDLAKRAAMERYAEQQHDRVWDAQAMSWVSADIDPLEE